MNIKKAIKWLEVFRNSKFKCIAPTQVFEAMKTLGMIKPKSTKK
jgi:hypothetical protein